VGILNAILGNESPCNGIRC